LEPGFGAEGSRPSSAPASGSTVGHTLTEGKCQLDRIRCPRR